MTSPVAAELPQATRRRFAAITDWWFALRNRILADPGFQRWAARFPLTRLIARRRAAALFDLCAGFVYSQVLYACVRLRLFDELVAGPQTLGELGPKLGLRPDVAARLLAAAASLKLAEARGGDRFGLGVHGASLVGNPAVARMIEHHALLYRDLAEPLALLRGETQETALGRFWSYSAHASSEPLGDGHAAEYSTLMASSLALIAADILEAYPLERHRQLLDVGGGEGAFVTAAAAAAPRLSLALFDLPAVAARARVRLAAAGLAERATVIGGDLFADRLPTGADLVSLVRVLHDHDDAQALEILRAVRVALPPGGVLLVAEPMSETAGAEPMGAAYFGFYLLAMGQGRPRTPGELRSLLLAAGFVRVRTQKTRRPMLTQLLRAEAP